MTNQNNAKIIWVILDHPWQLYILRGIVKVSPKSLSYHLIISEHKYWKLVDINQYRAEFGSIRFFQEPDRANTLQGAKRFYREVRELQREVKKLPIRPDQPFLILSVIKYLENIITSVFPKNRQILLIRHDLYKPLHRSFWNILSHREFRITKSGYFHHFVLEPLLGLKKCTYFYWFKGPEQEHDISFSQPLDKIYDEVFILKPTSDASALADNEVYAPYAMLLSEAEPPTKKRIVFFLSGQIPKPGYYEQINHILQRLKEYYGGEYFLELRRHPNDPGELERINYAGWTVNNEPGLSDEYLVRHYHDIVMAIAPLSTALMPANSLGIPVYNYFRCMGFAKGAGDVFERNFEGMREEAFLDSLDAKPTPYNIKVDEGKVRGSLEKLFNLLVK